MTRLSIPGYGIWACALGSLLLAGHANEAAAKAGCRVQSKPVVRASTACRHGLPVRAGGALLVPKACRIPMGKTAVIRHAVEIRDPTTGKRLGQASLPAVKAAPTAKIPTVGAILAGPIPLYVFKGGVGAIDPVGRRAELVFEPSGRLAALARHGEVLSVIDALPADATFPKGSMEWTVLDFGKGEMLGQARLAGTRVDGAGFWTRKDGLHATLLSAGKKGPVTLAARVRDAAGKASTSKGLLRPTLKPRKAGAADRTSKPAAGTCPVVEGPTAIRPELPPLSILKGAATRPASGASGALAIASKSACLAATPVDKGGLAWAWLDGARGPALHGLKCDKPAATSKRGATTAKGKR